MPLILSPARGSGSCSPPGLASCGSNFPFSPCDIPHQLRATWSLPARLVYCFPLSAQNGDFVLQPLLGIGF